MERLNNINAGGYTYIQVLLFRLHFFPTFMYNENCTKRSILCFASAKLHNFCEVY